MSSTGHQWMDSFNVNMRQEVTPAAHFVQLEPVHHLSFRGFVNVFLCQINDLLRVHSASHFQPSHFTKIVFVFVCDHVSACKTLDGDDHCIIVL